MIILNNMYTGRYITQHGKLGHESINLVRADNDNYYIWLNSMGVCTKEGVDGATVIMVRSINSNLYKVLAKAEDCELCDGANISRKRGNSGTDDKEERYKKQKALRVTYNQKCPMDDIFDDEKDMFATFCTTKMYEPKEDTYLTTIKENKDEINHVYYADFKISEAMRAYISDASGTKTDLNEVLKADIWKEMEESSSENFSLSEFNFFKLIRKDKDELSFSNALAYFIDKAGVKNFLGEGLGLSGDFLNDDYKLLREKNNIDISFFGENNVVIIENKIDAFITFDARKTKKKQLEDAVKTNFSDLSGSERKKKEQEIEKILSKHQGKTSQLSKYYFCAVAYLLSKKVPSDDIEKHIKCFLLIPEYSKQQFAKDNQCHYKSDFLLTDKYKIITYKDVSEFFEKNQNSINDSYLKDFISALGPLKKEFNNEIEEEMKHRFFEKIGKI